MRCFYYGFKLAKRKIFHLTEKAFHLDEGKREEWKSWLKTQHSKNEDHGICFHNFMANRRGKSGNSDRIYLGGTKITVDSDCSHEIKRCLLLGRKAMTNLDSVIKKQRHHFADKGPSSQSYGFSSRHVWMWELGHKQGWAPKNWCFQIAVLEKTFESLGLKGDLTSQS